jgi:hypothetical protein
MAGPLALDPDGESGETGQRELSGDLQAERGRCGHRMDGGVRLVKKG